MRPRHLSGFCSTLVFFLSPLPFSLPPCLRLSTWQDLSLIPGERPGCGIEWQWARLPCGRTGWAPSSFADDPVLPFSIKRDLCLGWMTLSFSGELGLTCAWKMASLMGGTMGLKGKKVPEARNGLALCFESITQTLSFSFRISTLCPRSPKMSLERRYQNHRHLYADEAKCEYQFYDLWSSEASCLSFLSLFPHFIKRSLVIIVVVINTYCVFTIS